MSDSSNQGNGSPPAAGALQSLVNVLFNGIQVLSRLQQTMAKVFPQWTGTTASSATGGSASALPPQPVGYIVLVNPVTGATVKMPFYS